MLLAVLALTLAACGGGSGGTGDAGQAGGDASATVELSDFEIDAPAQVTAGTEITVTNTGQSTHNWTAEDDTFATDDLAAGEEATVTIDEPGTYPFLCTIHPDLMTGSIEVTGS